MSEGKKKSKKSKKREENDGDVKKYIGAHVSIGDGYLMAGKRVLNAGGNLVQIFLTSPKTKIYSEKSQQNLEEFNTFLTENKMKVVIHASYLINLAADWDENSWWFKNIIHEIECAHVIGAIGIVLHLGKQLALQYEHAMNNMFTSIVKLHNRTKKYKDVKIIIETAAGQGSEMCYKMEDLGYFYNKFKTEELRDRVKICIDTCHIFAAGYNLKTSADVKKYIELFDKKIGLGNVALLHLNDSYKDVGSKVDRHAKLGEGYIGMDGIQEMFKYFKDLNVPILLETPDYGFVDEIRQLLLLT